MLLNLIIVSNKRQSQMTQPLNICYVSPVLTTLKTVRYTKSTCTLAKFHIMARYMYQMICTNFGNIEKGEISWKADEHF